MRFAKNCFDVGIMVDAADFRIEDWTTDLGLALDHVLEIEAYSQYRFLIGEAVLKVNAANEPLPQGPPSGLSSFGFGTSRYRLENGAPTAAGTRREADGQGLDVEIATPSVARAMQFYSEAFGLKSADASALHFGPGRISFRERAGGAGEPLLSGYGIRYLTFQIFDADEACEQAISKGARLGRAPVSFEDVARYGFVCDPDGNWIELSARASVIAQYRSDREAALKR